MKKMMIIWWGVMVVLGVGVVGCGQPKHIQEQEVNEVDNVEKKTIKKVAPQIREKKKVTKNIHVDDPTNPRNYIINFTGENVKKENKVLDTRQINPYKGLPYSIDYISRDSLEYQYDLRNISQSERELLMKGMRINEAAYRDDSMYLKMSIVTPIVECKDRVVAIAYQKIYFSNEEDVLGTQGVVILYNEKGKEVRRIEDKEVGFEGIRLSDDGKYLLQQYGFTYGEDGGGELERGFRFYDTATGKMIFEWGLGKDQFIGGYDMFFDSHLATFFRREGNKHEKYIIDYINKEIYKKSMDRRKYSNNYPGYRKTLFPTFLKTRSIGDLLKDGFKKIK